MKFTEEEYKEIVYMFSVAGDSEEETRLVAEYVSSINHSSDYYKALAIANPLTREWAHEQFVEKEKRYVWRDKYTGYVIYKMLNDWSLSATALGEKHFTETEINNSPFKPEWFDKEEAE